jgi:hypothetical protein
MFAHEQRARDSQARNLARCPLLLRRLQIEYFEESKCRWAMLNTICATGVANERQPGGGGGGTSAESPTDTTCRITANPHLFYVQNSKPGRCRTDG